jgi:alpha-tubulin suppressor-like RCC1 family protein
MTESERTASSTTHLIRSSRARRNALLGILGLAVLAACHKSSDASTAPPTVASVTIAPTSGTVVVGQTLQLAATTYTQAGVVLTGQTETWTSSATTLATVSTTGLVTGIAPGTVTITVTSGTVSGTSTVVVIPIAAGAGPTLTSLSVGFQHTCGITTAGAAVCWGSNTTGQLGNGTTNNSATPVTASGGIIFKTITAGFSHSCAVTSSGAAYCWGDDTSGELGDGHSATINSSPSAVSGGLTFKSVTAGSSHTCGLTTAGVAYCWGSNESGDLGNGTVGGFSATPVPVAGGLTFASLSAGFIYTCGVTVGGAAYCWGGNGYGVLGNGTTIDSPTPVAVSGGLTFATVSAAGNSTCGVTTGGAAYCWGNSAQGQLGTGVSTVNSMTPVAVIGGFSAISVGTGSEHACAVATGGAAYCWGDNSFGELGLGSTSITVPTPGLVLGGLAFAAISAGNSFHTCGLTTAGAAYCWGYNDSGEIGNGTTGGFVATPVPVVGGS